MQHKAILNSISEKDFQQMIIQAAELLGWQCYHVPDSRRVTSAGYPDLTLIHPGSASLLFVELKTERGKLRPEQRLWLETLRAAGVDVRVWKPHDWSEIEATLRRT
jgi:hypothetical protein